MAKPSGARGSRAAIQTIRSPYPPRRGRPLRARSTKELRCWIDEIVGAACSAGIGHADNFEPAIRLLLEAEPSPDLIARAEVLRRHRLADDRGQRGVAAIPLVDRAAVQDRNAQYVEVAWSGPDLAGEHRGVLGWLPVDDHPHPVDLHRQASREDRRFDAGNL